MLSLLRWTVVVMPLVVAASCPVSADAGMWWSWGNPGYASSYYAPYSGYASYAPQYYGPSSGCCGSTVVGYGSGCGCDPCGCNPCGCSPCGYGGCSPCGGGGCGLACASGSCAGGNCGWNAAPADGAPIPESNPLPRTTPGNTDAVPPRRTYDGGGDAPVFDAPTTPSNPSGSGMDDPLDDGTGLPPRTRPRSTEPEPDGFVPRPPSRSNSPVNPLESGVDPADPNAPFGANRPMIPPDTTVIPQRQPAETSPVEEGTTNEESNTTDDAPALETNPVSGPQLDLKVTTMPVVQKTRLATSGSFSDAKLAQRIPPSPRAEWSAAPSRLGVVRH